MSEINVMKGEECPICHNKTLVLMEAEKEIPYFGKVLIFSMDCESCKYHKADVETNEKNEPVKYTFEIENEEDLKVRVIKSSEATVKFSRVGSITPGPASNGYITNIEGLVNRMKKQIESIRDNENEDKDARKKAKNLVKKLQKVLWGREKLKIIIEDPSGNSAIISDKAKKQNGRF